VKAGLKTEALNGPDFAVAPSFGLLVRTPGEMLNFLMKKD
jgi:hypothetical protein